MIVIDIGNTNVVIAIYSKKNIKKIIRLDTKNAKLINKLDYNVKINKNYFHTLESNICIISSVSSHTEVVIINYFRKLKFKILNISLKNIPKDIKFNYTSTQLGADRIANTFAAINKYGGNSIVVDFGTATTFDLIKNYSYAGGLIAPGIMTSHDALVNQASKLNKISIKKINKIIGNNTKTSMQIGFYWGYLNLINGILRKIILEKKIKPKIIITGGLASTFKDQIKFKTYHEPNLTLDGLYLIGQRKYE